MKAPMGGKCQATFWNSTVGIMIILDDLHYVTRVVMKTGTGVEMDAKTHFQSTAAKKKPNLLDLMKVSSPTEFGGLIANICTAKKQLQCLVDLTPSLAPVIQHTDMTYAAIFVEIIKQVRSKPPTSSPK